MAKKSLQEVTDLKVMGIKDCLDALGWTYEENEETKSFDNIACQCGGELEFRGFIGTEVIECTKCGKYMVDLFSPIQTSNSTCGILNPNDFDVEADKHWVALDGHGGIKA